MTKENDLLANEIGKIGGLSGVIGGPAGMVGGFVGANLVARLLPTKKYQTQLTINANPEEILVKVYAFLSSNGQVNDSEELRKSPYPTVAGVIGSGGLNLNPAILCRQSLHRR